MKKKFWIKTYGCALNQSNTEIITGQLRNAGFVQSRKEESDLIIINTCGVKKPTEDKILFKLKKLSKINKPVIVAGCLTKLHLSAIIKAIPNYGAILGPYAINKIVEISRKVLNGERGILYFPNKPVPKLHLPKERINKFREIIQISEGCPFNCTYCAEKKIYETFYSYEAKDILSKVSNSLKAEVKEIYLSSLDTGAYGLDLKTTIIDLLKRIIALPYKFKIRLGMMNPYFARKYLHELIKVYSSQKMYLFLHVPIQSGSNKVLEDMNRPYKIEEVISTLKTLRSKFPLLTIVTDVIVGYPTETEEDFNKTLQALKEIKPDKVNISKFFPRPGTKASTLPLIPPHKLKPRIKKLRKVTESISLERNMKLVNSNHEVLITEKKDKMVKGRLFNYKSIHLKGDIEAGEFYVAFVEQALVNFLKGRVVVENRE